MKNMAVAIAPLLKRHWYHTTSMPREGIRRFVHTPSKSGNASQSSIRRQAYIKMLLLAVERLTIERDERMLCKGTSLNNNLG
eukprot:SAG31_NODE_10847_length_1091_cov_1.329637_1_plen_81_part_01